MAINYDLDPGVENVPEIDLDSVAGRSTTNLGKEDLADKVNKVDIALGANSPGVEDVDFKLKTDEDSFRRQSSEQKVWQDQQLRNTLIRETLNSAARQNRQVSEEESKRIFALSSADLQTLRQDPETFFEREYARRIFTEGLARGSIYEDAKKEDEGKANEIITLGERTAATKELVLDRLKQAESRWKQKSTVGALGELAFQFSGLSYFNTRNNVEGSEGGFLAGNNLEAQRMALFSKSPEEAKKALDELEEKMVDFSELDKMKVLKFFLDPNFSDKFLENVVGVFDAAGVGGLAATATVKGAKLGASTVSLLSATKALVRSSGVKGTSIPGIRSAVGDLHEAAFAKIKNDLDNIRAGVKGADDLEQSGGFSIFNPGSITSRGVSLDANAYDKMRSMLYSNAERVTKIFEGSGANRVIRTTPEQELAAMDEAVDLIRSQYQFPEDAILDVARVTSDANRVSNTAEINVTLGKTDGSLFESPTQAEVFAKFFYGDIRDYNVVPKGKQFAIQINKPINEVGDASRSALRDEMQIDLLQGVGPLSIISSVAKRAFSGNDVKLTSGLVSDFKKAVVGANQMAELAKTLSKPIGKLRGSSKKDFIKFLEVQRKYEDPNTGKIGRFSKDQLGLEKEWVREFNRLPTNKESQAYWASVQMNDFDWLINNMATFTQRKRNGHEMFGFNYNGPNHIDGKLDDVVRPDANIRGVFRESVDWSKVKTDDTESILVWNRNLGDSQRIPLWAPNAKQKHDDLIERGYKVIQLSDEGASSISGTYPGLRKGSYRYVMVSPNDFKSAPISLKQIPYRPGGHVMYPQGWFMSQASISASDDGSRQFYTGDINLHNFGARGNAIEITERYNKARELLVEARTTNNFSAFENYMKTQMPINSKEFRKLFSKGGPGLDINRPFLIRPSGQSTFEFHKLEDVASKNGNTLRSATRSSHSPDTDIGVRFGESRDHILTSVDSPIGDSRNPIFGVKEATLIDPVSAIDRATNNLARSVYLDDLKIKSGEEFLAKYAPILEDGLQDISSSPIRAMLDGQFKKGAPPELVKEAEAFRDSLKQLLNIEDDFDAYFNLLKQRIADSIYDTAGSKAFEITKPWLLHRETRPTVAMRSIAFDLNLGLFAPMQLLIQSQSWVHVAALEGMNSAVRSGAAATLQAAYRHAGGLNKPLLGELSKSAKAFGWTADEFVEATESMSKVGWDEIGGGVSQIADYVRPRVINGALGTARESGRIFFNAGERYVRRTAWNASYIKWRRNNPGVKLDQRALDSILSRADTLAVNMTAASNAGWQRGITAIPTQFMSFQARLMEQFWGKQLTNADRFRIAGMYSAFYGIPVGATGPAVGALWPGHEEFRKHATNNWGTEWNEDLEKKILMEGLPSFMLSYITGEDYNVATRLGPGGNPVLRDLLTQDKSFAEALMGASGTTIKRSVEFISPLYSDLVRSTVEGGQFDTPEHMRNFLALASSGRVGIDIAYALGLSKEMVSMTEQITGKADLTDALFKAVSGITPQKVDDFWRLTAETKNEVARKRQITKNVSDYYKKAIKAAANGASDQVEGYIGTAYMIGKAGGLSPIEISNALNTAVGDNVTLWNKAQERHAVHFTNTYLKDLQRRSNNGGN